MGWTDERVELLKKLWQDGLSCSQIAKQLGGVTRNAVLGKVHRLGISGRAAPSKPQRTVYVPKTPKPQRRIADSSSGLRPETDAKVPARTVEAPAPVRYVEEDPGSATMLTLGNHMCRWPIGDPALDTFTFCGHRAEDGPYCYTHEQVAYQPAQAKKTTAAAELARSLRRYI